MLVLHAFHLTTKFVRAQVGLATPEFMGVVNQEGRPVAVPPMQRQKTDG